MADDPYLGRNKAELLGCVFSDPHELRTAAADFLFIRDIVNDLFPAKTLRKRPAPSLSPAVWRDLDGLYRPFFTTSLLGDQR